jgi:prefoldin subunit 5
MVNDIESEVLTKLKKQYRKDEAIMWGLNRIKELRVERGKTNAYIAELEDKIKKLENELRKKERITRILLANN